MAKSKNLDFFFSPGSVAVVGASDRPGKLSGIIIDSLKRSGFAGRIFPVNPAHSAVHGISCHPSIESIGEDIDLAVYAIPAEAVPGALENAGSMIKGAVVVSGGFSETGGDGKALEERLKETALKNGVRLIGPNCMGIFDAVSGLDTFFIPSERIRRPGKGGLSIVSQSGSFAITAMDELAAEGIGVARVVSYGNKADVNESDCLEFLAADASTAAVALYVESIDDGRRFVEAASACSARKPVMAVKVGKKGAGASAARSHTGAIAGRYEVYRAAFKKARVIELDGYEEFIDGCKAFSLPYRAKGGRVMIITDGGGMGVGLADACHSIGLDVPELPVEARDDIKGLFPPYFAVSNPLDLTGSATDGLYQKALESTARLDFADIIIVAALWGPPGLTDGLAEPLAETAMRLAKPVIICSPGGEYTRKKAALFRKAGLPVFTTPESAARAAAALARAVV